MRFYILQENGDRLLQENGFGLLLEHAPRRVRIGRHATLVATSCTPTVAGVRCTPVTATVTCRPVTASGVGP